MQLDPAIIDQLITDYGVPIMLVALIGYMAFIVFRLGMDSKAGKFGMFVLFLALMFGVLGFAIKFIIKLILAEDID